MASSLYNKLYEINQVKTQKITASNLKTGVNAFGINGTFTSNTNALSSDIANGKTAYVNGSKVTGTLKEYDNSTNAIPFYSYYVNNAGAVINGYYNDMMNLPTNTGNIRAGSAIIRNQAYTSIGFNTISRLLNIQPVDIKKGAKILDIEGQYDASTEFSGIKMDPVVESDTSIGLTRSIKEISGLDMANGTNLSYYFSNLYGLTSVSNINTPNATNLFRLFYQSYNLKTFTAVNMYGEEQTDVSCFEMFANCTHLEGFSNVKFPKVISSCSGMFNNCSNLTDITSDLNISGIANVPAMFGNCYNLVNVTNIMFNNTTNLTLHYLFYNCQSLNILGVPFDNIRVTGSNYMFSGVKSINDSSIYTVLNKFNLFYIGSGTFSGTSITKIPNFANVNSNVRIYTNTPYLFSYCNNMTNIDDTEHLLHQFVNIAGLFQGCSNLQSFNGTVNNNGMMAQMFSSCSNLETVNIGAEYSVNRNFYQMFFNCNNLVSVNFLNDINYISNGYSAFQLCENLTDLNLNVNSIYNGALMFKNCKNLKRVNIRNNINGYLYGMFQNCYNLSSIGTNILSSTSVNCIENLFANCSSLIGDMTLEINNTSFTNSFPYVFYNTGLSNITANIEFNYTGGYAINMNYFIENCKNLRTMNVHINDRYGSINYFNAQYFGYHCPNLENINASFRTNRMFQLALGAESKNIKNVALDVDTTNGVTLSLYDYNAQSYAVNITNSPVVNCYMYQFVTPPKLNVTNVNSMGRFAVYYVNDVDTVEYNVPSGIQSASNLNLQFVNNVRSISINSMSINNVSNMNDITVSNINNVSNVSVITNIQNANRISIAGIFSSNSTNIDIPYIRSVNTINIQIASNISSYNLNFTGLNTINTFNFYSVYDSTKNVNININMCNVKNSIPLLLIQQIQANADMFINLANASSINRLNVTYAPSLHNFNYDFSSVTSINTMYFYLCYNLSDNTIDNLLGLLGNVTYNGTKRLSSVFSPLKNTSVDYWVNLPNYNNLIAKGWTLN